MSKIENINRTNNINILECTLRDGSYAIDFKFTLRDTAELAGVLSEAGFKYIEVGHGVGLGATRAGKGNAPWSDKEVVKIAKSMVTGKSLIGVFCIPRIATFDDMEEAKEAGLDFIRIGENATAIEKTLPYIEKARRLDLIPIVNFMKSYTLPPEELAAKARIVTEAGAEVIYIVDSAGGMTPEEISRYCNEIRKGIAPGAHIGFHGHNNLGLAVANSLEAIKQGAIFIDTTLYGMGRSAGNAPTEVMVALLARLGFYIGPIDLFNVMDIVEDYIQPLASRITMYDMLAVSAGYSFFHSSFLPQVLEMGKKHNAEIKRLVAAMGKADPSNCPEDVLEKIAIGLTDTLIKRTKGVSVAGFKGPEMNRHYISNTLQAAVAFIEELEATASKMRACAILDIVPLVSQDENAALSEIVLLDEGAVIGRIYYGSEEVLNAVLKKAQGKIRWLIVDVDSLKGARPYVFYATLKKIWKTDLINFYSSSSLFMNYITNAILNFIKIKKRSLLIYGKNKVSDSIYNRLYMYFDDIYFFDKSLRHNVDVILAFSNLSEDEDIDAILDMVNKDGLIIIVDKLLYKETYTKAGAKGIKVVNINPLDSYRGLYAQLSSFAEGGKSDVF